MRSLTFAAGVAFRKSFADDAETFGGAAVVAAEGVVFALENVRLVAATSAPCHGGRMGEGGM